MNSPEPEYGVEDAVYEAYLESGRNRHLERRMLGRPHPDRAAQFVPFAALKGYEALVAEAMNEASDIEDFFPADEPC